ncbi:hypothetical protein [Sulfobacillus harzensis]|uniref:Uncharacterized protein n=1 Tax=Sulfobacillus harzensis TaxID=2729629 RepID=A0A7Y0Q5E6_9FIRM|nr:hypothetical protein [Sulfobacillus harzensis]NMP25006.1 hypothetical protein [Sulfobacillus harzensis]
MATNERRRAGAGHYGVEPQVDAAPVQVFGTGKTLNEAVDNAVDRTNPPVLWDPTR